MHPSPHPRSYILCPCPGNIGFPFVPRKSPRASTAIRTSTEYTNAGLDEWNGRRKNNEPIRRVSKLITRLVVVRPYGATLLLRSLWWYMVLLQTTKSQRYLGFRATQRHWQPVSNSDGRISHERRNVLLQRRPPQDLILVRVVRVCAEVDKVHGLRIILLNQT